jgi:hypothetical protein
MEQELKIRGYVDPRTGEYKIAREINAAEVQEDLGFIMAWKFYWDGPLVSQTDKRPVYDRETWLEDSFPPEEVPALAAGGVEG